MRAMINYAICVILFLMGLVMTYVNLHRPEIGPMHWVVVGLMFAGSFYSFRKAEDVSE